MVEHDIDLRGMAWHGMRIRNRSSLSQANKARHEQSRARTETGWYKRVSTVVAYHNLQGLFFHLAQIQDRMELISGILKLQSRLRDNAVKAMMRCSESRACPFSSPWVC